MFKMFTASSKLQHQPPVAFDKSFTASRHLDPSDLPGHTNISDRRSAAGRRSLVLATNRNGGMLRLNASRHDD